MRQKKHVGCLYQNPTKIAFTGVNLLSFLRPVVELRRPDPCMKDGHRIGLRGVGGPHNAAEQSAESRQPLFEMMPNLTLQFRSFLHQVASMAGENLELVMDCIDWLFHESKPIHRCAKNGVQIVVIALVVTISWLAIIA